MAINNPSDHGRAGVICNSLREMSAPQPTTKIAIPGAKPVAQPAGLYLLFLVEMWERFSYYGMRALLVLYLVSLPALPFTYLGASGDEFPVKLGQLLTVQPADGSPELRGRLSAVTDGGLTLNSSGDQSGGPRTVAAKSASWVRIDKPANPGPGWSDGEATLLYGWYTGLAYLLPIMGGFIADRFIGTHRSMIVGGLLIALGHITLAVSGLPGLGETASGMAVFLGGLALIILGTGHFKPCVSVMVGQLYGPNDPRRDGGFTLFYMGINLGAFLCAFVVGTLGEEVGWHWGFGAAAVGMILGLTTYLLFRERHLAGIGLPPADKRDTSALFFLGSVGLSAAVAVAYSIGFFGWLGNTMDAISESDNAWAVPAVSLALVVAMCAWLIGIQEKTDRAPVTAILIFILFNTFFWMAFEQAGSTLNLFADHSTDRSIGDFTVPATWFQSVNPLLIMLLAPAFAALWSRLGARNRDPSQAVKIGLGLLLLGAGYVVMVVGARGAVDGVRVGMIWLLATYTLHTLGELCLSPTGLAFVTRVAPVKFVSLLMGVWFLSSFAAGVLGGMIGSTMDDIAAGTTRLPWSGTLGGDGDADFFMLFVVTSIGGGVVILALARPLGKLLHGRDG